MSLKASVVSSVLFGLCFLRLATANQSPNIILILADDQEWNALSTLADPDIPQSGSPYFQTPNLDQLAQGGMRFSWAYSGGPTCSPSRHAIQFGRSPASLGIVGYAKNVKSVKLIIATLWPRF